MKRFAFEPGTCVTIDGTLRMITDEVKDAAGFMLVELSSGNVTVHALEDLLALLACGTLEYAPAPGGADADGMKTGSAKSFADLSEKRRKRVELKMAVLKSVDALVPATPDGGVAGTRRAINETSVLRAIAETCTQAGVKPVSLSTYYDWRKKYLVNHDAADLVDRYENRGRRPYLDPLVDRLLTVTLATQVELAKARGRRGVLDRISPKTVLARVRDALPSNLKPPSRSVVADRIKRLPAYDLAVARQGPRNADNMFRGATGLERPEVCLDRVEYDETRLRMVVVDEDFGIPLGFPYLSWYVDATSTAPLGFYVGFEPMSDVSTMAALRHACLPKTYMKTSYPECRNTLVAGVPRGCVFDNGLTQHANTIHGASIDIGFDYKFAPPYTPWFKSAVENMHNILNDTLLSNLPGFKIEPSQRPDDYDPKRNACIGLRHFVHILHRWVADRYMLTPTGPFSLRPIDRWRDGTSKVKPTFLANARDLDQVFGILRSGNLDHRGVRYENLWYRSGEMPALRRQFGASVPVAIKVNPADLGSIRWQGPDGKWRTAEAQFYDYARGRGLYQHRLILRFARDRFGSDEAEALVAADRDFRALGAQTLASSIKLRKNAQIARAFGIGTEALLGSQGHDGALGASAGPFRAARNPFGDRPEFAPSASNEDVSPPRINRRRFPVSTPGS